MTLQIRKMTPFGAEIDGIDLRLPVGEDLREQLRSAFLEHAVLLFRGHELDKREYVVFMSSFGRLQRHVIADYRDDDVAEVMLVGQREHNGRRVYSDLGARFWHADGSASQNAISATGLYAFHLPSAGGNTEIADQRASFAALPADMKRRIAGMKAVHDLQYSFENTGRHLSEEERAARKLTEGEMRVSPPVEQPVVAVHPETGREALFVGYAHTSHIVDMPVEAGRQLIHDLVDFATQPRFVYSHQWARGDVMLWDNRCTLHRGTPYPRGDLRVLWRASCYGEGVRSRAAP